MNRRDSTYPRAWPVAALAAGVELLVVTGALPAWAGLTNEVALPPLGLVTDMRVLLSRAASPAWFAAGLMLALAVRIVVLAALMGWKGRLGFAVRFYLAAVVPAYVAAELAYCGQALLYAVLLWAGMAVTLVLVLAMGPLPWSGRGRLIGALNHGLVRGMRAPTIVAYFAGLAVLGALVEGQGRPVEMIGVVASASMTMLVIRRLASPGIPAGAARLASVAILAIVGLVAFLALPPTSGAEAGPIAGVRARPGTLVLVAGMGTSSGYGALFSLDPMDLGFSCGQTVYFSYSGPGRGARRGQSVCPIRSGAPYDSASTEYPLEHLVSELHAELSGLKGPITVVTHSEGAWIAWEAIRQYPAMAVSHLIMLAPLDGGIGYPQPGTSGRGMIGAAGMRLVVSLGHRISFTSFSPDAPLASEVLGQRRETADIFDRRLARSVRALVVESSFDLPVMRAAAFPAAAHACPVPRLHGAIPTARQAMVEANRFLDGARQLPCEPWDSWPGPLSAGMKVP